MYFMLKLTISKSLAKFGTLVTMAYSSEKFCLKWNDFQQNIVSSYQDLRKDSDFCDVTLVCEDNQQLVAHKIVLVACSPFFSSVLKRNKYSHPMIYMRGIKANDLVAIVDFIYLGEANIYQDDLDNFLAFDDDLQLKGLLKAKNDTEDEDQEKRKEPKHLKPRRNHILIQGDKFHQSPASEEIQINTVDTYEDKIIIPVDTDKLHVPIDTNKEDLKAQLDSMMVKAEDGETKWICTICGKAAKGRDWGIAKFNMRKHIETHMEGLSYPCNQCGKVSR